MELKNIIMQLCFFMVIILAVKKLSLFYNHFEIINK